MNAQDTRSVPEPQPGSPHRHPRHRAGRRAGGVLRADAGGSGRRRDQGRAAGRQPHAPHRALLPGPRGSRALPVLLAVQPRQALDRARPAPAGATASGSARWSPPPTCCWSRRRRGELDGLGLGADALMQQCPTLIVARMSPFGDEGPWADFKGSDLVHLALGGVMMNCGYDPGARRHVRPAADRAADVARLPHRRRAARRGDHRRAALSLADGQGPARCRAPSTRRWRSPPRST